MKFSEINLVQKCDFFCTKPCFTKVLDTIEKMHKTSTPRPFSQNCQYKKNQPDDGESDGGKDDPQKTQSERASKKKKNKGKSSKKKKKVPAQLSKAKLQEKSDDTAAVHDEGVYEAKTYSILRKKFIDEVRETGLSYKDANEKWNSSAEKCRLLSTLSLPELKRRRFVSKDCEENPWSK